MFAYDRKDNGEPDDCRLYTLPFSESLVTNHDDFTLYLRVCTNTGTWQSTLLYVYHYNVLIIPFKIRIIYIIYEDFIYFYYSNVYLL